jgi:WD40 repeat protein
MTRETIITGSDDWTARVWSLTRGTCDAVLTYHDSPILCVEYSPSDKGIITGMWPLLTFNARWAELCQIISMSDIWSLINMSGSSDGLIRFWENKGDVFWIVKITSSVLLHLFWTLFRKKCVLAYLYTSKAYHLFIYLKRAGAKALPPFQLIKEKRTRVQEYQIQVTTTLPASNHPAA